MKRLTLLFASILITFSALAQVSGTLSYQGYLTDDDGEPVNDGESHSFVFTFYDEGGSEVLSRTISSEVDKGLFSVIIGGGTGDNSALPTDIWDEEYTIGIAVDGGTELSPRIPLTTVPYSFQAETANNVDGANISGTIDASLLTGTIANGRLDSDLQDLADGELSGSLVGSGIDGSNITNATITSAKISGTIAISDGGTNATTASAARTNLGLEIDSDVQAYDDDLDDLADGELSGSKVGSGISGANITNGTIPSAKISGTIAIADGGTNASTATAARTNLGLAIDSDVQAYDSDLDDLSDGELSGDKVGSGIDAGNITTGTLPNARLDTDVQDLADGELSGSLIGSGIDAGNITTGTVGNGRLDADLQDLADGSLTGTLVDPDFGSQNIQTTGNLAVGGSGTTTLQVTHGNGNPSSGEGLSLLNNTARWTFAAQSGGELYLYYGSSSLRGIFSNTDGAYSNSSDRRIKKNISELNPVLPKVLSIPIYRYHYNTQDDHEQKKIGTIAQDLLPIFPSMVQYAEENDFYTVNYSSLSAVAIKAIQEQQQIIDELREKLAAAQQDVSNLKTQNNNLETILYDQEKKIDRLFQLMDQQQKNEEKLVYIQESK